MRLKTHLAISLLFMIIFLPHVVYTTSFVIVILIATILPNLDQVSSYRGVFKPLRLLLRPRGFLHSFTFCLLITFFFAWYLPILSFPFFLGYSIHLLVDAWTVEGIKPFWPINKVSKGRVRTGGSMEETIFMVFVILDIVFAFVYFL